MNVNKRLMAAAEYLLQAKEQRQKVFQGMSNSHQRGGENL